MSTDVLSMDREALWPARVNADYVHELRDFADRHIAPYADQIDRDDIYPVEILKNMAKAGYNTAALPSKMGGQDLGYSYTAAIFEEIGAASAAVGISLITIYQAQTMISLFGQDSLKQRYLPAFSEGLLSSYALTEASHGSDIRTLETKAYRKGDEWVIQGEKHFITSATASELFIILAETEVGVSVFAVPRDAVGLSIYEGKNSATFGLRNGPHMNVKLEKVCLPADHMIGEEGRGVRQAVTVLNYSRTMAGAISLGVARAAFEGALAFARDRIAFDQRVFDFQGIRWYFADMLTEIDAARLLIYHAAEALDSSDQISRWGSEAKLKACSVATQVATQAAQICGAYGIMVNAPFGRYLRDAKAYEIAGGSSEILKNTIGKAIMPLAGITR